MDSKKIKIVKKCPYEIKRRIPHLFERYPYETKWGIPHGAIHLKHKLAKKKLLKKNQKPDDKIINQNIKKIMAGDTIIDTVDAELSKEKTIELLKELINKKGFFCIYLTFNLPFEILLKQFKKAGINTKKMYFFDTITRLSHDVDADKQCSYLHSPKQLEYLFPLIKYKLEILEGKKFFLILDSLTNILHYNDHEQTMKFVHSLANKLRLSNIGGRLIVTNPQNDVIYESFNDFIVSSKI